MPSKSLKNNRSRSSKDRPNQFVRLDDDVVRRKRKRGAKKPTRYLNLVYTLNSVCNNLKTFVKEMITNIEEPCSYKEAMENNKDNWHLAIELELRSLAKNNTWELTLYKTRMRV